MKTFILSTIPAFHLVLGFYTTWLTAMAYVFFIGDSSVFVEFIGDSFVF